MKYENIFLVLLIKLYTRSYLNMNNIGEHLKRNTVVRTKVIRKSTKSKISISESSYCFYLYLIKNVSIQFF